MRMAGAEGAASAKAGSFSQTATQRSAISEAAISTSSNDAIAMPESTSASGMLGVITEARGNSWRTSASTAASAMSAEPDVATITGSTTTLAALWRSSPSAMAPTMAGDDTMPIFTASGRISSKTASIWVPTKTGSTSSTPVTPSVF